jgi:hypothetical protein
MKKITGDIYLISLGLFFSHNAKIGQVSADSERPVNQRAHK